MVFPVHTSLVVLVIGTCSVLDHDKRIGKKTFFVQTIVLLYGDLACHYNNDY